MKYLAKVRSYPAKLLLFGEHTVLVGSSSLAIPLPMYTMSWVEKTGDHPSWLSDYSTYLKEACADIIDITKFESWIDRYTIQGNIPIGYGLGSSGALTAAIYDICGSDNNHEDYDLHQSRMAKMESFFHGESSGFDPLISFVGSPVLRSSEGNIIGEHDLSLGMSVGLIDSGKSRVGRDMIKSFRAAYAMNNEQFFPLISINTEVSSDVFHQSTQDLTHRIRRISELQMEVMSFLITPEISRIWKVGLQTDQYYMKICGAGGGGYYLVFAADREVSSLKGTKISWIS